MRARKTKRVKKSTKKNGKPKKKKLTFRQQKLLKELSENIGNKGGKSLYQMMLDAGYSESCAKQQTSILGGIQGQVDEVVAKMEEKRNMALDCLTLAKFKKAGISNLVYAVDVLTKNQELLSGRPTGREASITHEEERELDKLLKDNEQT